MKRFILIIVFVLSCVDILATEQERDILWIDGEKWYLEIPPMDLLDEGTRISVERSAQIPDESGLLHYSSACHRGYIAEWVLQDSHLVLQAMNDFEMKRLDMNLFMPHLKDHIHNGHVRVDWINDKSIEITPHSSHAIDVKYIRLNDGKCFLIEDEI